MVKKKNSIVSEVTRNYMESYLAKKAVEMATSIRNDMFMPRTWSVKDTRTPQQKKIDEIAKKKAEIAEKKRRAKKITMTVGELEDKLEDARSDYDY